MISIFFLSYKFESSNQGLLQGGLKSCSALPTKFRGQHKEKKFVTRSLRRRPFIFDSQNFVQEVCKRATIIFLDEQNLAAKSLASSNNFHLTGFSNHMD